MSVLTHVSSKICDETMCVSDSHVSGPRRCFPHLEFHHRAFGFQVHKRRNGTSFVSIAGRALIPVRRSITVCAWLSQPEFWLLSTVFVHSLPLGASDQALELAHKVGLTGAFAACLPSREQWTSRVCAWRRSSLALNCDTHRLLFHGTSPEKADLILRNGFSLQFAGRPGRRPVPGIGVHASLYHDIARRFAINGTMLLCLGLGSSMEHSTDYVTPYSYGNRCNDCLCYHDETALLPLCIIHLPHHKGQCDV